MGCPLTCYRALVFKDKPARMWGGVSLIHNESEFIYSGPIEEGMLLRFNADVVKRLGDLLGTLVDMGDVWVEQETSWHNLEDHTQWSTPASLNIQSIGVVPGTISSWFPSDPNQRRVGTANVCT